MIKRHFLPIWFATAMFGTGIYASPAHVILETDMALDVDDVGALATLHALADMGEANILGVVFNEVHPDGPPTIFAINQWYGRKDIPIAKYASSLAKPDSSRYLTHVANMAKRVENMQVAESLEFYRNTLGAAEDRSVTIISVGFLNSIADLLRQEPTLVANKIEKLVAMGGLVNDNFNFVRHDFVDTTQYVLEHWPTPLVVTDFGGSIRTGSSLSTADASNPVREAYFRWFNGEYKGRSSWDQIAVLVGVRGEAGHFSFANDRNGRLRNGFEWELDGKQRTYAKPTKPADYYVNEIEKLMTKTPMNR